MKSREQLVEESRNLHKAKLFAPKTEKAQLELAAPQNATKDAQRIGRADYDIERKIREELYLDQLKQIDPDSYSKLLKMYRNSRFAELGYDVSQAVQREFDKQKSDADKKRIVWQLLHQGMGYGDVDLDPESVAKASSFKGIDTDEEKSTAFGSIIAKLRERSERDQDKIGKYVQLLEHIQKEKESYEDAYKRYVEKYKDQLVPLSYPSYKTFFEKDNKAAGRISEADYEKKLQEYEVDTDAITSKLLELNSAINTYAIDADKIAQELKEKEIDAQLDALKHAYTALDDKSGVSEQRDRLAEETNALVEEKNKYQKRLQTHNLPFLNSRLKQLQEDKDEEDDEYLDTYNTLNALLEQKSEQRKKSGTDFEKLIEKQQDYLKDKFTNFSERIEHPLTVMEARAVGGKDYAKQYALIKERKNQQLKQEYLKAITPWLIRLQEHAHEQSRANLADEVGLIDAKLAHKDNIRKRNIEHTNQHYALQNLQAQERQKAKELQEALVTAPEISKLKAEQYKYEQEAINQKDKEKKELAERALMHVKHNLAEKLSQLKELEANTAGNTFMNAQYGANKIAADGRMNQNNAYLSQLSQLSALGQHYIPKVLPG